MDVDWNSLKIYLVVLSALLVKIKGRFWLIKIYMIIFLD